ncbi:MAG: M28 family metallopeptidase [Flavobacteriia bacterium]
MHKFAFFLLFCCTLSASAQIEEVRRITQRLCSPEMHGRGYVNMGDSIAAAFIANEFQVIGIEPLKGGYFQEFEHTVNTFPGAMSLRYSQKRLTPGVHFMVDPSSSGVEATLKPKRVPIETILNQEELALEIRRINKDKELNCIALDFSKATGDTLKKIAGLSKEIAKFLPVIEITNQKFTWSVSNERLPNPLILIQDSVYQDGQNLKTDIQTNLWEGYTSRNVIAFLPGTKGAKKTIVFTAHYDHLGRMGELTYFPGANDNASGTAMLLTLAKYFKEHPVNVNILFIAFAGEEAGLLGSEHFVNHPTFQLKKMNFLVNLDIMGSGEEGITVVNATLFADQFKLLQEINTEKGLLTQVKSRGPAQNSDHYWFTEKGVPAFFIYTMGSNKNYHDVLDTYENLTFSEYNDITTLLAEFVLRLQ